MKQIYSFTFYIVLHLVYKLDWVAALMTQLPPVSSTTLHSAQSNNPPYTHTKSYGEIFLLFLDNIGHFIILRIYVFAYHHLSLP